MITGISILGTVAGLAALVCGLEWYLGRYVLKDLYGKRLHFLRKNGKHVEILRLEHLENPGAAGGLLKGRGKLLDRLTLVCLALLVVEMLYRVLVRKHKVVTGYGMLLAGGISNYLQRRRKGTVTDYIRFPFLPGRWLPKLVFNLADFFVFLGCILALFNRKETE